MIRQLAIIATAAALAACSQNRDEGAVTDTGLLGTPPATATPAPATPAPMDTMGGMTDSLMRDSLMRDSMMRDTMRDTTDTTS